MTHDGANIKQLLFLLISNPIECCPGVSYSTCSKFLSQSDSFLHPPHQHPTNRLLSKTNTCLRALYFLINTAYRLARYSFSCHQHHSLIVTIEI